MSRNFSNLPVFNPSLVFQFPPFESLWIIFTSYWTSNVWSYFFLFFLKEKKNLRFDVTEREGTGAYGSRLENRKSLNPILRHPPGREAACLLVIQVFETQILADYRPTKLDTRGQAFCAAISYGARRRIANVPRSVNILSRYAVTNDSEIEARRS